MSTDDVLAIECQHCYCICESDTGNRWRYRCCQCNASFEIRYIEELLTLVKQILCDRQPQ